MPKDELMFFGIHGFNRARKFEVFHLCALACLRQCASHEEQGRCKGRQKHYALPLLHDFLLFFGFRSLLQGCEHFRRLPFVAGPGFATVPLGASKTVSML